MMPPSVNDRVTECPALPRGWKRKEVIRRSGLASAKVEVSYISPSGRIITNKGQLVRYLGDAWDLSLFDFQSGRVLRSSNNIVQQQQQQPLNSRVQPQLQAQPVQQQQQQHSMQRPITSQNNRVLGHQGSHRASPLIGVAAGSGVQKRISSSFSRPSHPQTVQKLDNTLIGPIRQTASIFKQPVTLVHTTKRDTTPAPNTESTAHTKREKPKQLFWAKRLKGLRAFTIDGESDPSALPMPTRMQPVGPDVDDWVSELSLAASLQAPLSGIPITGQTGARKSLDSNPGVSVNADQPLIQATVISEGDIQMQEKKVAEARLKLEQALKDLC